jgi:hypothetical protein
VAGRIVRTQRRAPRRRWRRALAAAGKSRPWSVICAAAGPLNRAPWRAIRDRAWRSLGNLAIFAFYDLWVRALMHVVFLCMFNI